MPDNEAPQTSTPTAQELLNLAYENMTKAFDLHKASAPTPVADAGGSTTEIIGHPGTPDNRQAPEQHAFGRNQYDQSGPTGSGGVSTPDERGVESGARERIMSARERSRHPGSQSNAAGTLVSGTRGAVTESEEVFKALAELDADGNLVEALDASPALTRLTDAFAKSFDRLANQLGEITGRLDRMESMTKSLGDASYALVTSQIAPPTAQPETPANEDLTKAGEQTSVRSPMAGIGIFAPGGASKTPTGHAPERMTKSMINDGMMSAVNDGKMSPMMYDNLSMHFNTMHVDEFWSGLPSDIKTYITDHR